MGGREWKKGINKGKQERKKGMRSRKKNTSAFMTHDKTAPHLGANKHEVRPDRVRQHGVGCAPVDDALRGLVVEIADTTSNVAQPGLDHKQLERLNICKPFAKKQGRKKSRQQLREGWEREGEDTHAQTATTTPATTRNRPGCKCTTRVAE